MQEQRPHVDNGCGAIQSDLVLAPGASTRGPRPPRDRQVGEGEKGVGQVREPRGVRTGLAKLKRHWHGLIGKLQVNAPTRTSTTWRTSGRLQCPHDLRVVEVVLALVYTGDQRDGFGFRDTVQDMIGVTGMIPSEVKSRSRACSRGRTRRAAHNRKSDPGRIRRAR